MSLLNSTQIAQIKAGLGNTQCACDYVDNTLALWEQARNNGDTEYEQTTYTPEQFVTIRANEAALQDELFPPTP